MAEFVGGDVVVVPFPFTDLQSSKRRPAVVLATFARGDLLICQITSRSESHPTTVAIGTDDFLSGGIDRPSVALPHRLVTVHEAVILRSAGTLTPPKLAVTPSPNLDPGLVRESSCPGWGWKGFSHEEATQCQALDMLILKEAAHPN